VETSGLRDEIDRLLAAGDPAAARAALAELWRDAPDSRTASFVVSRFERIRADVALPACRVAVLRSFTVEPLVPLLRAAGVAAGLDLTVHVGDFGAYAQEMLDPASALYRFSPDVVILAVRTADIAPDLWAGFAELGPGAVRAAGDRVLGEFAGWMDALRRHSPARLVVHGLELPDLPGQGILDAQLEGGQRESIRRINSELAALARARTGVYVLDYEALVARHGHRAWHDERRWLSARLPIASTCLVHLAEEWVRFLCPLAGRTAKVLALDLDNTLWGGIVGEDGPAGIALGPEHPGAAHQALQRAALDLHRRGVILAVCSKNNPADAMEILERHPGMLLRPEHFAALRINWNDKVTGLREIAAELDLGLDALVFVDDNPAERALIRQALPEVSVLELPPDPGGYARALRESPLFERLALSAEDRARGRYYAGERMRAELERSAPSLEDFYRSLEMEAEIALVTPGTLARAAQLTQKTNQFNLTTRRYAEPQLAAIAADPSCRVYTARLRDRFGDSGLVGVVITRSEGEACEIDTLLMSCRVIGRTLETALLATVIEQARMDGVARVVGWYLPTRKNGQVRELYRAHGFSCVEERDGASRWELDPRRADVAPPPWIKRHLLLGGASR
jgi:FkbH-like protein